ncbi:MAG TPA: DMT family transporter [Streptosporangiaceae bacterium]
MYIAVTLVAAMLSGVGFVLQQHAAEQVRSSQFLGLGLIARLVHNRRWLAGFAVMVAGYLVAAWTLGHLDLSVTEPLLSTNLIFALFLAVPLSGQALRRTEIVGALLLTTGVAALSLTRSVHAPVLSFGSFSHWPAAGLIAVIAVALVQLGRRRSGTVRATLTGTAAGLFLGIADAFTRLSVQEIDGKQPLGLLDHWPGYATILASIIGLWLMQNAFNAAQLHASLPAVTAAEPAAGIVLGIVVFGDVVHVSPPLLALQVAGIAAMVCGVILVARAPVFRDLHVAQLPHAALERLHYPVGHSPRHDKSAELALEPYEPDPDHCVDGADASDGFAGDQPSPRRDEAGQRAGLDPGDGHRAPGDLVVSRPDGHPAGLSQSKTAVTITEGPAVTGRSAALNRLDGRA